MAVEIPRRSTALSALSAGAVEVISAAEMALREGVRPFAEPDTRVPGFRRVFASEGALVYEVLPDSAATTAP
jgi:hypothetical protein